MTPPAMSHADASSRTRRAGRAMQRAAGVILLCIVASRAFVAELPFRTPLVDLHAARSAQSEMDATVLRADRGELARVSFACLLLADGALWLGGAALAGWWVHRAAAKPLPAIAAKDPPWTSEKYRQVYGAIRQLRTSEYFDKDFLGMNWPAAQRDYARGSGAMMICGSWLVQELSGYTNLARRRTPTKMPASPATSSTSSPASHTRAGRLISAAESEGAG